MAADREMRMTEKSDTENRVQRNRKEWWEVEATKGEGKKMEEDYIEWICYMVFTDGAITLNRVLSTFLSGKLTYEIFYRYRVLIPYFI